MKGLTDKQKNMIEFIEEFMNETAMAPTIYEIAEHFGIKTSTVFAHIRALQKKNILTRSSKARSIALVRAKKKAKVPAGLQAVPVVDNAGIPLRDIFCDSKIFRRISDNSKDLFAMHVNDSSLNNMGILNGDIVIMKSRPSNVCNGDIILTEMNGHDVFRSCRTLDNGLVEMSSGPDKNITQTGRMADFPVKGVVIGLQRSI